VGGRLWWMWAFSSSQVTVYAILPGRGFEQAARVLGADFDGFLVRDGWSIYRQLSKPCTKACLASAAALPRNDPGGRIRSENSPAVCKVILQQTLQLRQRR
jgi:hypothetical protein